MQSRTKQGAVGQASFKDPPNEAECTKDNGNIQTIRKDRIDAKRKIFLAEEAGFLGNGT